MKEHHTINFLNPLYHDGVNATTRLGTKWAMKIALGDTVQVTSNDGKCLHKTGEIVGAFIGKFNLIPDDFIRLQHSPDTQNRYGLSKVMKQSYGDDFDMDSVCTVILFNMQLNPV